MATDGRLAVSGASAAAPLGRLSVLALDGSFASALEWAGVGLARREFQFGGSGMQLEAGIAATGTHGSTMTAALRVTRPWLTLDITAGLERAAQMEPSMLPSDARPFVLVGTVHAPGTPHDTLTIQQAAERIARRGNRLAVHGVFTPVVQVASNESGTRWSARVGVPSACCTWLSAAGSSRHPWAEVSFERAMTDRVDWQAHIGTRQRFAAHPAAVGRSFVRFGVTVHRAASDSSSGAAGSADADRMFSFTVTPVDSLGVKPEETRLANGRRYYLFRCWAPRAGSVRVRGDFSNWEPVALTRRSGGLWELRVPLSPGFHFLSAQVNEGKWSIPPGMARGVTDYDEEAGTFLVDGDRA